MQSPKMKTENIGLAVCLERRLCPYCVRHAQQWSTTVWLKLMTYYFTHIINEHTKLSGLKIQNLRVKLNIFLVSHGACVICAVS